MKLTFLEFEFDKFHQKMQELKDKSHYDYLVTIVGEDFPKGLTDEGGLGCVYILENTENHKRCSVKMMARTSGLYPGEYGEP